MNIILIVKVDETLYGVDVVDPAKFEAEVIPRLRSRGHKAEIIGVLNEIAHESWFKRVAKIAEDITSQLIAERTKG